MLKYAIVAAMMSACSPVMAAQCLPWDKAVAALDKKYGESRQTIGLSESGSIVEQYSNLETHTWTLLITTPDGQSCVIAYGDGFDNTSSEPKQPQEPNL